MANIYGLGIETDTSPLTKQELAAGYTSRGADPRITPITTIALSTDYGPYVLMDSDERTLLERLNLLLGILEPGVLATWNGAVFDLPFLHDRAKMHGVELDLKLVENPGVVPEGNPTPGHAGGYDATWGDHEHVDVAYLAKDDAEKKGLEWSLKPYAAAILGTIPETVDRENLHELSATALRDYVASDAIITRELAQKIQS